MKKVISILIAATVASVSVFAIPHHHESNIQVINALDVTHQDLTSIMEGNFPDVAVEFCADTTFPLYFFVKGELMELKGDNIQHELEIKQTFYVRCTKEGPIFSFDLMTWKPLLEFVTGEALVSLGVDGNQVFLNVGAILNCRR